MINYYIQDNDGYLKQQGTTQEELLQLIRDTLSNGDTLVEGLLQVPPKEPSQMLMQWHVPTAQYAHPRLELDQHRARKWEEIKSARDASEFGGFEWDGSIFDSDAVSQSRIQGAVQLASLSSDFTIEWTLADNSTRILNSQEMAAIGATLGMHVARQHTKARNLRALIDAATGAVELDDITWS